MQELGFGEIMRLGRAARRIIEQGRIELLRGIGFECRVVEYVSDWITPDNLLLIAHKRSLQLPPRGLSPVRPAAVTSTCRRRFIPDEGCILHLATSEGLRKCTAGARIVEYLLEQRCKYLLRSGSSAITAAWSLKLLCGAAEAPGGAPTMPEQRVVLVEGRHAELLPLLLQDRVLLRAVDQLVPFSERSGTMEAAVAAAVADSEARWPGSEPTYRVVAYPAKAVMPSLLQVLYETSQPEITPNPCLHSQACRLV